jgi:hypothetical protein
VWPSFSAPAREERILLGIIPGVGGDGPVEGSYLQDDVERSLRASLVSVLSAALADEGASGDYLKGVFDLARCQAALYGISWRDLLGQLRDVPELWNLELTLQDGCRAL